MNLKFNNLDYKIIIPVGIAILAAVVLAGYFIYRGMTTSPQANPQNPQQEVQMLVSEVGKLIELPKGEDPTIATVTDVEKLRTQPFFLNAQNGDKVLIYQNARKAIIYSPSLKKVIEVAPLNIGTESGQLASPSPTPSL